MNFLECEVAHSDSDRSVLTWRGKTIHATGAVRRPPVAARVLAAVRPEDITLSPEEPTNAGNAVRGVIRERIFRGSEVRFVLRVEGEDIVVAARQHNAPEGTDALWMSWKTDRTIVVSNGHDGRTPVN
jgi:ABC-type Fe3+/spermidine/putrescine transport system ATPase subunit